MANKPCTKRKGRPEDFNQELADKILNRISAGEFLSDVCKSPGMPHRSTVRRWIDRHPEFDKAYTRARELLGDFHFEAMIRIADDASGDKTLDAKGNAQVSWENVQRSKLRIETRRWVVARLNPAKYSEKIVQQHTGANDGPIEIARKEPLTTAEVAAELSKLIGGPRRKWVCRPEAASPSRSASRASKKPAMACCRLRFTLRCGNMSEAMPPPFTEPLTNEDYAWLINYMIVAAEAVLRLNRKDSNGNELLLRERADQILRAASGNRKIEPRFFQLAWLIARTCAITPEQTAGPPCKRIHGHG